MAMEPPKPFTAAEIGVLYALAQNAEASSTQKKDALYMATLQSVKGKLERMLDDCVKGEQNETIGYSCNNPGSIHDIDSMDN